MLPTWHLPIPGFAATLASLLLYFAKDFFTTESTEYTENLSYAFIQNFF
jgi:hypothetical protein